MRTAEYVTRTLGGVRGALRQLLAEPSTRLEAERLLPPLTERLPENLPEAVLRWEYEKSPAGCPMPEDAPDNLAAVQLLRLKAKVSARLHLHTEVRTIHARLGNKYQHIEELIKNIQP